MHINNITKDLREEMEINFVSFLYYTRSRMTLLNHSLWWEEVVSNKT